ncbi:DNA polymerase IV [Candidatus Microgenomates bacterium]|nr:DNA polymerase IV [Candidatus Microgenomates bacterium]
MKIIAHLDMDYFFAQIEERENPDLKGRPVVIGADPKAGKGRGVVSTANYEARKFGIHSAMPISWAYRACPEAVFLFPRHDFYSEVSHKIRNIIKKSLKRVVDAKLEQVSIDEFYLDISSITDFKLAQEFLTDLKSKICKIEGLTCSVGLATNKLLAKIASGFKKPGGFTIILQESAESFLFPLPVETLPGVGPKTKQALNRNGIKIIADLQKVSRTRLGELFGKWGENIWASCRGIDDSEVEERGERKTIGVQTTFERDTSNYYFLRRTLFDLCQQVWQDVQKEKLSPKTIEVTIRYFDFETHSHQKTLKSPIADLYHFRQEAESLLKEISKQKPVRLFGVRVGGW